MNARNLFRKLSAAAAITAMAPLAMTAPVPALAQTGGAPAGCSGKTATGTWLNVVATGMRSGKGELAITVYADKRGDFLAKGGSIWVARVDAVEGTTRGCVFLPATGVFAIALYHDEDGDKSFDRSGIGLPAEGYGFSNNPATLAGLPSFGSVRMSVPKTGMTAKITMKYP
jgi:uncharacterized protein (DUF2141 family)